MKKNTKLHYLPGPYVVLMDRDGCDDYLFLHTRDKDEYFVSRGFWADDAGRAPEQLAATAQLLAAAPQMYKALIKLLAAVSGQENPNARLAKAVRKADRVVALAEQRL